MTDGLRAAAMPLRLPKGLALVFSAVSAALAQKVKPSFAASSGPANAAQVRDGAYAAGRAARAIARSRRRPDHVAAMVAEELATKKDGKDLRDPSRPVE